MTALTFMDDLCRELKLLFSDFRFLDESGETTKVNIYQQSLPIPSGEDDPEPFPYIVVRAEYGGKSSPQNPETIKVGFIIGVYDDNLNNQGHKDVLLMIDRIRQMFERNPLLCKKYYRLHAEQHPINWTLQDEDSHPYFFGGIEMTFALPTINQEDENA